MKYKKIEIATWLSLSFGLYCIINAIFCYLFGAPDLRDIQVGAISVDLILFILVFYVGYTSFKQFKNKQGFLFYNTLLILIYSLIIFNIVLSRAFGTPMIIMGIGNNIYFAVIFNLIFAASFLYNGLSLLSQLGNNNTVKMRRFSWKMLLLAFILLILIIILVVIDLSTRTSGSKSITGRFEAYSPFLEYAQMIIAAFGTILFVVGLCMLLMSFLAPILLKNLLKSE